MVYAFLSAAKWQQLSWSWTTASTTLLDVVCALAASDGVCWTAAATLLDEVYAFFHAARWCAQSWSWTAAANTLLEEVYAFLCGDCCCCNYAGQGLRLPSRRQVASVELDLEGSCCYPT